MSDEALVRDRHRDGDLDRKTEKGDGLRIREGDGPGVGPADRAGVGFDRGPCLAYSVSPASADHDAVIIASVDHLVLAEDEVRVAFFPEWGEPVGDELDVAGSYVGIRVRFADGTTTGDDLLDQYGIAASPQAQGDSGTLPPFQWTLKRFALSSWAGARATTIELVWAAPAPTTALPGGPLASGWVEYVGIAASPRRGPDPIDWADTRLGTRSTSELSRGNTVPIASHPHGSVFAVPVTDASRDDWVYTWSAHADEHGRTGLEALAISSIPSPWVGERGSLQVFPVARDGGSDRRARRRTFRHDAESARPHEYSVVFDDGSSAAARAGRHAVEFEFTDPTGISTLVIDQLTDDGHIAEELDGHGRLVVAARVDGTSRTSQGAPARFVWITCDAEVRAIRADPDSPHPRTCRVLELAAPATAVRVRIGVSYVGVETAQMHAEREMPWSVSSADIAERGRRAWEPYVTALDLGGATDEERVSLVSSLARMHVYPNDVGEPLADGRIVHVDNVSPSPSPDGARSTSRRVLDGAAVVNNGFWDTYRTIWPWFALRDPEQAARLFEGMLAHGRDGGWMPRWSAPGYADAMVGTSSDIVAATILQADPNWSSAEAAYDLAVRNATVPPARSAVGRRGLDRSRFRGWVDDSVPESVSWTLEGATCDAAIARMARTLHERDPHGPRADEFAADAAYFALRSRDYVNLFDSETGFFRGRDEHGRMRDGFDARRWGGDYTETNAWGMAFAVPQDPDGLAALHGGRAGLRRALDTFFSTPETAHPRWRGSYPTVIHEMVEARNMRMGMFGLSNQPAHHIPYLYAATDRPWRTQEIVGAAVRTRFTGSDIGAGYPGDEDNGEMSAWLVLSSLGLYPLMPGAEFVLTTPLLPLMRLHRPIGDLVVEARGDSRRDRFVQGVTVDGQPWDRPAVPAAVLATATRIVFSLGEAPSRWGAPSGDEPKPPSARRDLTRGSRIFGVPGCQVLIDDRGASVVSLAPGGSCTIEPAQALPASVYTVTVASAGDYRWRVSAESVDGGHRTLEVAAEWDLANRTRAFAVPAAGAVRRFTIENCSGRPLPLTQLELFEASGSQR